MSHEYCSIFTSYDNPDNVLRDIHFYNNVIRYNPAKRLDAFDALAHPFFDELRRPDAILPGQ